MRMTRNEGEMNVKMRSELLNRNTKRGNAKEEGKRKHQRQHTWPGAGEPQKGKGKEKTEADGNGPRPAEGGKTDAPEQTYHGDLSLPKHARTQTYLERESRMKLGTNGGKLMKTQNQQNLGIQFRRCKGRALLPERERGRSTHKWACNSCADLHELGAQWVLTSPDTKETTPKGKPCTCCLVHVMHIVCKRCCCGMLRKRRRFAQRVAQLPQKR